MGEFSKYALDLDVRMDETIRQKAPTRADANGINMDEFNITFKNVETSAVTTYVYGEMPEIVTLKEGTYTVTATYGEDRDAEWENPYFLGKSDEFSVSAKAITTNIGTIKCQLKNVKTSIVFDPILKQHMSDDAYVEVKVGKSSTSTLNFTTEHSDNGTAGYFRLGSETTLVATFHGTVDGAQVSETKTLSNIEAGNHYRITFKLHNYNGENTGEIGGNVSVDASVDVTKIDCNVPVIEDEPLNPDELEFPKEDNGEEPGPGPDEPGPGPDEPGVKGPTCQVDPSSNINLDEVNEVNGSSIVILNFTSHTGFDVFEVDIVSDKLTPEELEGVGLSDHLDLITPGALLGQLQGLGIMAKDKESVEGDKEVKFDISKFMTPLSIFPGVHEFKITVGDSEGTNSYSLKLKI